MQKDDVRMQQDILNDILFVERNNADTLYYHQDKKDSEAKYFKKSIIKKVNSHIERNHWEINTREKLLKI